MMPRHGSSIVIAATMALASACSNDAPPPQITAPTATVSAPAATSPVASPSPASADGCRQQGRAYSDTVSGRDVVVALPQPSAQPLTRGRPVIVALHGYNGTDDGFMTYTGLITKGPAAGAVVIAPQGERTPAGAPGWNVPRSSAFSVDDVAFIDGLLERYRTSLCLDLARVTVTGWSDGADMAVTYACHGSHPARRVIPMAAAAGPDATCSHVTDVWVVHGKKDPIEPYNGGSVDSRPGFNNQRSQSAHTMLDRWAAAQHCTTTKGGPITAYSETELRLGCVNGGTARLISLPENGHPWPGSTYDIESQYGPTEHRFDLTQMLLEAAVT